MKSLLSLGAAALALTLAGCGGDSDNQSANVNVSAPLTQIAAPNGGDWTQVASETPDGGFRIGNPNAPVKLVEYASISCPHCAEFSETASDDLQNVYVRSGQVSWEYRPFLLFPSDPAVFMLLRCQGPTPFFQLAHQLYATQRDWEGRLQAMPEAQQQQLQGLPPQQRLAPMIQATGLDQFFRQRGMPEARIASCLADPRGLDRLTEITRQGTERDGVEGTPTFIINGEKQDIGDWPGLQRRLRAAMGH